MSKPESRSTSRGARKALFIAPVVMLVVMVIFFWRSFHPDYVLFSNDGPLGFQKAAFLSLPASFVGQWFDLNTLGANAGAAFVDLSTVIRWILGPVGYSKFIVPFSLWFLGVSAYFCFRRFGMSRSSAVIGGLAAGLVTSFFTNATWGAAGPIIGFGMDYLAVGALAKRDKFPFWIAPALAGMAIGLNVMEAADIGALFSMLIAAFVVYQSLVEDGKPVATRAAWGVGRAIVVAIAAFFIASYAVYALVGANITGIVGTKQDVQSKAAHWDFATSWSMPKSETPALFIPNLYGCNVITPGAANYWGGLGRDPAWDRYFAAGEKGPPPQVQFIRHTGRGIYLGCFVVFLAVFSVLQSFRKKDSVFTPLERRLIWFWFGTALFSLLLAFGRFAPFYRLIYNLPYFSTIRNPDKFLHIVTFNVIILFAYGIHGLHRRYLHVPLVSAPGGRFKTWWKKASGFDKGCVIGCVFAILLAFAGWGLYAGMRDQVANHLVELDRVQALAGGSQMDADALQRSHDFAASQVSLSLEQVGWFILFLTVGSGLVLLILTGAFAGRRAVWASIFLGLIVVGDLGRANLPYIVYWNYKEKYEVGNPEPIIKFLATQADQQRVGYLLPRQSFLRTPPQFGQFQSLYDIEWTQQLFPFYNILTPDIVQMPRMAVDLQTFNDTMRPQFETNAQGEITGIDGKSYYRVGRNWQLTATKYLVGPAPFINAINQQFDSVTNRFRIIQPFEIGPRPWAPRSEYLPPSQLQATPVDAPNATYALFEYTGALPRAGLFSSWQVVSNDNAALQELALPEFDAAKTLLLPAPIPGVTPSGTNQEVVPAKFISYEPADIKLDATPTSPSVLMMCDKYDSDWKVWVDGKPGQVLRCDYLMRGVFLPAGHHEVEFKFRPSIKMLYVNVAAVFLGLCMLGYAMAATNKQREG